MGCTKWSLPSYCADEPPAYTVICMELCDRGSLWAAVRQGTFRSSYSHGGHLPVGGWRGG